MKNYSVIFTEARHAELQEFPFPEAPKEDELLGRTLVSIISNGSETGGFMNYGGSDGIFPTQTGYCNIMEVLEVGSGITDIHPGDHVFTLTHHCLYNKAARKDVFPVPKNAPVEKAIIARFPAVSMTAFLKSSIKPSEPALVTGLGIVGLMCAQMLKRNGFKVYCTDVAESRREIAKQCGLQHVAESVEALGLAERSIGLCMECSGNNEATLSVIPYIRQGGDLMLVGVPWLHTSDVSVHYLFRQIFYGFINIRSGFEWEGPRYRGDFDPNCNMYSMETAMSWILDGSIKVDGIYKLYDPRDCTTLYPAIAEKKVAQPCCIFDWRLLKEEEM